LCSFANSFLLRLQKPLPIFQPLDDALMLRQSSYGDFGVAAEFGMRLASSDGLDQEDGMRPIHFFRLLVFASLLQSGCCWCHHHWGHHSCYPSGAEATPCPAPAPPLQGTQSQ
jgi:hypothetical protein